MTSETISQIVGLLWFVTVSYLGIRTAANRRKKSSGGSGGLLDTLSGLAQAVKDDTAAEKREDKIIDSWLTITEVLKETRALNTALNIERTELRAELQAAQDTRQQAIKARVDTDDAIETLRKDFAAFKLEASEREQRHQVQIEAQAREIVELRETNQRQKDTIRSLKEYIERLVPLLKKAGIDTKELPQLPDILETAHGNGTSERDEKAGD